MPWVSKQQQRWGHSAAGEKALGGASKVAEWDHATNFKTLPKRAKGRPKVVKGLKAYVTRAAKKKIGRRSGQPSVPRDQRAAISATKRNGGR